MTNPSRASLQHTHAIVGASPIGSPIEISTGASPLTATPATAACGPVGANPRRTYSGVGHPPAGGAIPSHRSLIELNALLSTAGYKASGGSTSPQPPSP